MSAVAVLLTALGVADLCRRAVAAAWVPLAAGPIVVSSDEAEILEKQATVWSAKQIRAGYDYLVRRASAANHAAVRGAAE